MPAHAQTPDLSLPALPDIGATLEVPALPTADAPPLPESSAAVPATPANNVTLEEKKPKTIGSRASADSIDDLLPVLPTKQSAPPTDAVPVVAAETPPVEALPALTKAAENTPPPTLSVPDLPSTESASFEENLPLKPPTLAEEAAAKGVAPPLLGLPPMPDATAQALLTGQPLGPEEVEEPEIPEVKVQRKPTVRDLPKLRPVIVPIRNAYNYKRQMLPPSIYKYQYSPENRHLPKAITREDYDRHLFGAVAANNINATRAFLNRGISVNLVNANGETLLMTAVRYGALDTARLLLARGADPRMAGSNGMTALQLAESSGQQTLAEVLRARGA